MEALIDAATRSLRKLTSKKRHYLTLANYASPICLRFDTSDDAAFHQVFIQREYSCLDTTPDPKFIVDLGANVGYASLYFLNRFPKAYVVAVEPDEQNVKICRRNLSPYSGRTKTEHAAIWSHECDLVVCKNSYRDKAEWATQVRERLPGEQPGVKAITLPHLLAASGFEQIDILKVDIERAEAVLFSGECSNWLDKVRNIAIELHDEQCEQIFFKAMNAYHYTLSRSGELTVLMNVTRKLPINPTAT
jgi:FkbM family methyltransferase